MQRIIGAAKPSKCLVICRAKEKLEQLENQNTNLRNDAETLKQQIAVLTHLLSAKSEDNRNG